MTRCPNCSYILVLLPHKSKYKCSKCGKLYPQGEMENKEFRNWNKKQRQLDIENMKRELGSKRIKLTKEDKKQRIKEYRLKNKDKIKESQLEYRRRNRAKEAEKARSWMINNRERYNARKRVYWSENQDKLNIRRKELRLLNRDRVLVNKRIIYNRIKQRNLALQEIKKIDFCI